MARRLLYLLLVSASIAVILGGCSTPLPWPQSPLHEFPETDPNWQQPGSLKEAMQTIAGLYAHYDVVAYEDVTTRTPMKTFVVSYGYTEFRIEDGKLYQIDRFCHAEQKLNQRNVTPVFSDEATQAIEPRIQEVTLTFEDGEWHIYRPATPTLLGITGDPSLPLSTDPDDPNITDPDGDGKPGVTVELKIGKLINGELYITRREIYTDYLILNSDGNLYGHVVDESEQFVVGASLRILRQQSNPVQIPDPGMNPMVLVRVSDDFGSCDDLMDNRDSLFPEEPGFL